MPTLLKNEYANSLSINKIRKRIKTKNGIKQATRRLWRIVGVETQEPSHTFSRDSKWWDQWTIGLAVAIHTYPSPTPTCLALLLRSVKSGNVDTCIKCSQQRHSKASSESVNCLGGSWVGQPASHYPGELSSTTWIYASCSKEQGQFSCSQVLRSRSPTLTLPGQIHYFVQARYRALSRLL